MFLFNRNKGYKNIDIESYSEDFANHKTNHFLLDVRSKNEYMQGHIPSAINIPLNELADRVNEIPNDKPVVVVCASGNRSRTGANKLVDAGIDDVSNLKGGTMAWMMSGQPIER